MYQNNRQKTEDSDNAVVMLPLHGSSEIQSVSLNKLN